MQDHVRFKVVSDDGYLSAGIKALCEDVSFFQNDICFIDIDMMGSVLKIRSVLLVLDPDSLIVGIGRGGVISRQFGPVGIIHIDAGLPDIMRRLNKLKLEKRAFWLRLCETVTSASALTEMQCKTFNAFKSGLDVKQVAALYGIKVSTCYHHSCSIVRKMNMKNINELRYFAMHCG